MFLVYTFPKLHSTNMVYLIRSRSHTKQLCISEVTDSPLCTYLTEVCFCVFLPVCDPVSLLRVMNYLCVKSGSCAHERAVLSNITLEPGLFLSDKTVKQRAPPYLRSQKSFKCSVFCEEIVLT